jgi:hypothetical protein
MSDPPVPVKIEPFHLGHFDAVGPEGPPLLKFTSYFNFEVGGVHTISNRHASHNRFSILLNKRSSVKISLSPLACIAAT